MDLRPLIKGIATREPAELAFAPLGLPLRIEMEDANHAGAVRSACRSWKGDAADAAPPLRLRVAAAADLHGFGEARIDVIDNELRLAGPGVLGRAFAAARHGWCEVSNDYLTDPDRLREHVLEPLALFLITHNGRAPIHAAGILTGDLAVLLAGPSGSGKSCLAVAADRAGLPVLSDDTVYLQRGPTLRTWGWRGPAHLLPGDVPGPRGATRIRNGKTKYAVPLRSPEDGKGARETTVAILKHGNRSALGPIEPDEAMRRLANLEPGFDLLRADIEEAHRLLTANGAWLLTLSKDPADAIALLQANLARLRATAV